MSTPGKKTLAEYPRVFLLGFMGSGKSTIGPQLAQLLGWSFADLDAAVEHAAGRSVAEIFAQEGESGFRARERDALVELCQARYTVVSLGGGAFQAAENRARIDAAGFSVYLRPTLAALTERLARQVARDPGSRPLLAGHREPPALAARIQSLLSEREAVYRQADYTLDIADREPARVSAARIETWLAAESPPAEEGPA